ncbi:hypothetical protein JX265_010336 [Neoarthrinium moseri]|uniref:Glycoside hydrolase protein n=1 Tax=Neoarthrinium moseri TaxID=1658444 RepID=A0A9P9WED2_9PEZI|nr:hypothetical protein JX265_010336 [Neoarthrinium moseri]
MVGQLPEGSDGLAAATLTFAAASLICSSLVIWLTWCHNERLSYVALLAYFTLTSTLCSLIQQIHDIAHFRDVILEQHEARLKNPLSPDGRVANGSTGMDLILYYMQFYCYQVMSMLVLWWASELTQSVYGFMHKRSTRKTLRKVNAAGKIVAIILPLIIILLLRTPPVQKSQLTFTVLTDVPLGLSMGIGSILMVFILARYIYSKRKLLRFEPGRGDSTTDAESQLSFHNASRVSKTSRPRRRAIYDRWLMTRFTIAFLFLAVFQGTATLFQQLSIQSFQAKISIPEPDLSASNANRILLLFIPGNLPGVALFVVFGTTTAFRQHMSKTLQRLKPEWRLPNLFRRNRGLMYDDLPSPHVVPMAKIREMGPDLMKKLPHRPDSRSDYSDDEDVELQRVERAKLHDRHSIYVMRTLSVHMTTIPMRERPTTDSSKDSTPSLVIMRQISEESEIPRAYRNDL